MLTKLLKNTKFRNEIRTFFKKNRTQIVDILLFGSITKGKEEPRDIDIMIIFNSEVDYPATAKLRNAVQKILKNAEITSVVYSELFSPNFIARESFLLEGYSLINNKFIFEGLGFDSYVLFRYDITKLNKSERMRFYYSLYGRNKIGGILKAFNSYKFSDNVILVPISHEEQMKQHFEIWRISYVEIPAVIPSRMSGTKNLRMRD